MSLNSSGNLELALIITADGKQARAEVKETVASIRTDADKSSKDAVISTKSIRDEFGINSAIIQRTAKEAFTSVGESAAQGANTAAKAFQEKFGYIPTIIRKNTSDALSAVEAAARSASEAATRRAAFPAGFQKVNFSDAQKAEELEKGIASSAQRIKTLSTYTDVLVAESRRGVSAAAQTADGADKAVERFSTRMATATKEAHGFGAVVSTIAGPIADVVALITAAAGALIGAGAALFYMTKREAEAVEQVKNLSDETNFSIRTLSGLKAIGEQVDVSIQSIGKSLGTYEKNMELAAGGNGRMSVTFQKLHLDTTNNEKSLRDVFRVLGQMQEGYQQTALAQKLFGDGGAEVLKVIKESHGDLDEAIKKYQALGSVLSEEAVRAAERFNRAYTLLQQAIGNAVQSFTTELMPEITEDMQLINGALSENQNKFKEWGSNVADFIRGVRMVADSALGSLILKIAEVSLRLATLNTIGAIADLGAGGRPGNDPFSPGKRGSGDIYKNFDPITGKFANQRQFDIPTGGRGRGGGGQKGMSEADFEKQQAEILFKIAQDTARELESIYRTSYDIRLIDFKEYKDAQLTLAVDLRDKELAIARKEKEAAEKQHDPRKREIELQKANERILRINNEFSQKKRQIQAEEIERERQRQLDRAAFEEQITSATLAAQLALYEEAAGQQVFIASNLLERVRSIEQAEFDAREKNLRRQLELSKGRADEELKINRQLELLAQERATAEERATRRIMDAIMAETRAREEMARQVQDLEFQIRGAQIDTNAAVIEGMRIHLASQKEIRRAELDNTLAALYAQHDARKEALKQEAQDRVDEAIDQAADFKDILELQKLYHLLMLEEDRRFEQEKKNIKERAYREEYSGFFSGEFRGALPELDEEGNVVSQATAGQNAIAGLNSALKDLKEVGKDSFGSFADALGQTAKNFILLGTTGPNALRKITASVLAEVAAQSLVKGIFALAEGFIHMFTNPPQSAADFTAAGLYFSIAAGAGVGGRKAAGKLFQQQQAAGIGGGGVGNEQPRSYGNFNYGGGSFPASAAFGEGSRNISAAINRLATAQERTNAHLSSLQTVDAGHVVAMGADRNPAAFGDGLQSAIQNSHDVRRDITSLGSTGVA